MCTIEPLRAIPNKGMNLTYLERVRRPEMTWWFVKGMGALA